MEDITKYNIKKKNKNPSHSKSKQVTYMLTYTECKTFNFGKRY